MTWICRTMTKAECVTHKRIRIAARLAEIRALSLLTMIVEAHGVSIALSWVYLEGKWRPR